VSLDSRHPIFTRNEGGNNSSLNSDMPPGMLSIQRGEVASEGKIIKEGGGARSSERRSLL
jgi:hypothetical protein